MKGRLAYADYDDVRLTHTRTDTHPHTLCARIATNGAQMMIIGRREGQAILSRRLNSSCSFRQDLSHRTDSPRLVQLSW